MGRLDSVTEWLDWYRASGAARGTVRLRSSHVMRLAAFVDPLAATESDLVAFLSTMPNLAPESRKSMVASLRSFYRWAVLRGHLERDPTVGLRKVHVPPGVPKPITETALRCALAAANDETRLMILLGCYAGLRRAEIAGVHSDHVAGPVLLVQGKGGRRRRIPVHPMLGGRLARVDGWAFPSPVRAGEPVTPDYVANRLERVLPPPYTAHSLRHWFATSAFRGSRNLRAVQELLGHSRPETTARYTLVDEDELTAAVLSVA